MLGVLSVYVLINLNYILIECTLFRFQPELRVRELDNKLIERKRQDTMDMCRIFTEETAKLSKLGNMRGKKQRRIKRQLQQQAVNPALNLEDAMRVESIVDKMYDEMQENGEKVEYRRGDLTPYMKKNVSKKTVSTTKSARRYNFAPSVLLGPRTTPTPYKSNRTYSDAKPNKTPRFAHGLVPYFIDSKTYDANLAEVIMKAFDYFEKVTCIRLQRLRERPTDRQSLQNVEWLYITNPTGIKQCVHSNDQTDIKGVQMIVFGYDCMSLGDITHEIMHVLGFSHEHTRPDRDHYITILWDNIKPGYKKYFERHNKTAVENLPYDYASVLHYPSRAFSRNGQVTIMTQPGIKVGQRDGLSDIDVEKINAVYSTECVNRNREYLLKTCPSVVMNKAERKPVNITRKEIEDYYEDRLWTYAIVNYRLKDKMEFSNEERENINAVIRHIEKETCIEFRDLTSDPTATIEVEELSSEEKLSGSGGGGSAIDGTESKKNDKVAELTDNGVLKVYREYDLPDDTQGYEHIPTDKYEHLDMEEYEHIPYDKYDRSHIEKYEHPDIEEHEHIPNDKYEHTPNEKYEHTPNEKYEHTHNEEYEDTPIEKYEHTYNEEHEDTHDEEYVHSRNYNYEHTYGDESDPTYRESLEHTMKILRNRRTIRLYGNPIIENKIGINTSNNITKNSTQKKSKKNQVPVSPSRRHATNILILSRSATPGCACPDPGVPGTVTQTVQINSDCFNSVNDLLHLFVHILGLDHQHNSYDRDSYLHIVWDQLTENVRKDMVKKLPPAASLGFPYDYQSVMHYPWLQIKNGRSNIMYPIWNDGWAMGHWQGLSSIDVQKLNLLYYKQCIRRRQQANQAELRKGTTPK